MMETLINWVKTSNTNMSALWRIRSVGLNTPAMGLDMMFHGASVEFMLAASIACSQQGE